ncbi:MAG TPA: DUF2127 domain-containing protein [Clostridiaceae bacterium]
MIFQNSLENTVIKLKAFNTKNNIVHKSFEIGILLKAIDGILEIIGGFILMFLNPTTLNRLIFLLTQHELSEDPQDIIASFMVKLGSTFSVSTQYFGVFYLISHGIIKFILVVLLWKRKVWAYPLTIVSLILFIVYQIYRYTIDHSMFLIILTIFDVIMILLTFLEYKRMKNSFTL